MQSVKKKKKNTRRPLDAISWM